MGKQAPIDMRAIFAELFGSFMLGFVAVNSGGIAFYSTGTLFAAIIGTGVISQAHFNPGITTTYMIT